MDVQLDHTERIRQLEKELAEKNRELSIEASLEKVRVCAMAMNRAEDMLEVCKTISFQLQLLGVNDIRNVQTAIFYFDKGVYMNYQYYARHDKSFITETDYTDHEIPKQFADQMKKGRGEFQFTHISKAELNDWIEYQRSTNVFIDSYLYTAPSLHYYWFSLGEVALGISTYVELSDDDLLLFKRFMSVFELAFRRHADIEKAEANAKEARIEAALERTRTQSMIMQHSNELDDTLRVFHEQVISLGIRSVFSFLWLPDEVNDRHIFWAAWEEDKNGATIFKSKAINYPLDRNEPATAQCLADWKSDEPVHSYNVPPAEVENYFAVWKELFEGAEKLKPKHFRNGVNYVEAFMKYGCFGVTVESGLADDEKKILLRFANEFERTYTRFLDLQKSEAQAKEAQIELALERVRAKAMAMQSPGEFVEVAKVIGEQFIHLGFDIEWANFGANGADIANGIDTWNFAVIPGGDPVSSRLYIPYFDHPLFDEAKKQLDRYHETGDDFFVMAYPKKIKDQWLDHLFTKTIFKDVSEEYRAVQYAKPGYTTSNLALKDTWLSIGKFDQRSFTDEQHVILRRFGKAFGQAYTRFLDLKKAEANAKEARIEAALEKVRSRSLAMHRSEELQDVVTTVFERLKDLGIETDAINLDIFSDNIKDAYLWTAVPGHEYSREFHIPYNDTVIFNDIYDGLIAGKELHSKVYSRKEKDEFLNYVFEHTDFRHVPEERKAMLFATGATTVSVAYAKHIAIVAQRYRDELFSEEENEILKRFAKVFEQAYIRFHDLKKAEANAREAQIEVALERVRARTMAMQHSNELPDAANILFKQMETLGMPAWSAGYCIWDDDKQAITLWMSSEGVLQPPFRAPLTEDPSFVHMLDAHQRGEAFYVEEVGGEELEKHYKYMRTLPVVGEILDSIIDAGHPLPTFQIFHLAYFTHGFLLFITYEPVPESHDIFKRFGKVFEQTYTRFLDLQKAEQQAIEAELEKKRSEDLLLNILPREIANELKLFGKSYARKHEQVTVLFTDIKGFSTISETLSAEELVNQLDECFRAFDNIIGKHGLEKIKTIGDAYVCACGLPNPDPDNAIKTVRAALDMLDFSKGFAMTKTIQDLPPFEFRFGINTGRVVTGVVGLKKFTYDIWGDAVNMAARMEQHGEPNKINISGSTYALVKDKFNCTHRGKIAAKNKGDVDMYFVEGIK